MVLRSHLKGFTIDGKLEWDWNTRFGKFLETFTGILESSGRQRREWNDLRNISSSFINENGNGTGMGDMEYTQVDNIDLLAGMQLEPCGMVLGIRLKGVCYQQEAEIELECKNLNMLREVDQNAGIVLQMEA